MFDANGNPVDASYTGQTYDWNGNATDPGTTVNPYTAAASTPAPTTTGTNPASAPLDWKSILGGVTSVAGSAASIYAATTAAKSAAAPVTVNKIAPTAAPSGSGFWTPLNIGLLAVAGLLVVGLFVMRGGKKG